MKKKKKTFQLNFSFKEIFLNFKKLKYYSFYKIKRTKISSVKKYKFPEDKDLYEDFENKKSISITNMIYSGIYKKKKKDRKKQKFK